LRGSISALSKKSKKRSGGKARTGPQPEFCSNLYLDENLGSCREILEILYAAKFPFDRHLDFFDKGTLDENWLWLPGFTGWPILTKDKAQRYTPLEKAKILKYKLKIFAFSSGNLKGAAMAELLRINLRRIDAWTKKLPAPFVVSITQTGLYLRFGGGK